MIPDEGFRKRLALARLSTYPEFRVYEKHLREELAILREANDEEKDEVEFRWRQGRIQELKGELDMFDKLELINGFMLDNSPEGEPSEAAGENLEKKNPN